MNQTKNRSWLAILGLSIGILEFFLLIVPIVIGFRTLGLGDGVVIPLALLLPVGLVGLIVSWVAYRRLNEHDPISQRRAKVGVVFNAIGVVIGVLFLVIFCLLVSSVFGQWF